MTLISGSEFVFYRFWPVNIKLFVNIVKIVTLSIIFEQDFREKKCYFNDIVANSCIQVSICEAVLLVLC